MNLCELEEVQTKFLCGYPVKNIDFNKILDGISWEAQKMFLQQTIGHPLIISKPISCPYQVAFLRVAIECLERKTTEVHEDFYTEYLRLQQRASIDQTHVFKHYRVPMMSKMVSIRESPMLISDGTTGLRTWPASVALCEWFFHNKHTLEGKIFLELGAGVGMAGIMLAHMLNNCKIYLTDFHEKVLAILHENINGNPRENDNNLYTYQFDWTCEADYEKLSKTCCPDIIYAADVIYDTEILPPLCQVLTRFIDQNSQTQIIISCTVRNKDTYDDFIEKIESSGLKISLETYYPPENFYWDESSEILIFSVKRNLEKPLSGEIK